MFPLVLSLFFSLIFLIIAFSINQINAPYFLSGYNTLSAEEKNKFNLVGFLKFFKKFHLFLSISLVIIGLLNFLFLKHPFYLMLLVLYPLIAYLFFIYKSSKFYSKNHGIWPIILISVVILVISISFGFAVKNNELLIENQSIEISGIYGETIAFENIQKIELDVPIPDISYKTNAFALGNNFSKGYFKTTNGTIIKLILNGTDKNVVKITKKSGDVIFYSSEDKLLDKDLEKLKLFTSK